MTYKGRTRYGYSPCGHHAARGNGLRSAVRQSVSKSGRVAHVLIVSDILDRSARHLDETFDARVPPNKSFRQPEGLARGHKLDRHFTYKGFQPARAFLH